MVPSLKLCATKALGHAIAGTGISIISEYENDQDSGFQKLQSAIEDFKVHLNSIPKPLHEEVCFQILNILEHRFFLYKNSSFASQVLKNLLEIVTHFQLDQLSSSQIPYTLRHQLYDHLHNLTELRQLEIKSVIMISMESLQNVEKLLAKALCHLKHLRKLTLYSYFTDRISQVVADSCTNLWYLNAKFSKLTTDDSVPYLIRCRNLKEVVLAHTSLTVSGYANLFLSRPELTRVSTNEDMNEILTVMIKSMIYPNIFQLHITNLKICNAQTRHLNFISKFCTNLRFLNISCGNVDFSTITNLVHLEAFTVTKADLKMNNIEYFLRKLGKNLKILKLCRVNNVDFLNIHQMCPNLRRLLIDGCSFRKSKTVINSDGFFRNLEHITCGENFPRNYLEVLLANCCNVRFLYLADIGENLTDQSMRILMQKNPMSLLEELCIYRCKYLSMKTVELLVKNCTRLRKLFGLERFTAISTIELKRFIRDNHELKMFSLEGPMFLQERFKLPW